MDKTLFTWTSDYGAREQVMKFYSITESSRKYYSGILSSCSGENILEYGCGAGSYVLDLALKRKNATVTGIDIDKAAIKEAGDRARDLKLDNLRFLVMNAENMGFKDHSFDLICGVSILHHLNLNKALNEIGRVINPGGRIIFMEPLGHNPALIIFRKLTPCLRDKDEHSLRLADIKTMKNHFYRTDLRFFHLFSFLAIPFRNTKVFTYLLNFLERVNSWVFNLWRPMRLWAWRIVIFGIPNEIQDPRRGKKENL